MARKAKPVRIYSNGKLVRLVTQEEAVEFIWFLAINEIDHQYTNEVKGRWPPSEKVLEESQFTDIISVNVYPRDFGYR